MKEKTKTRKVKGENNKGHKGKENGTEDYKKQRKSDGQEKKRKMKQRTI